MSGDRGTAAAAHRAPAGPDDRLDLAGVLAEERGALRGDDTPARPLDQEQASRLRAALPWRALCLSGGGLRAAVFSLGVAQGLAARGALHRFDYLSTASGGSYLGGALAAYAARLRAAAAASPSASGSSPFDAMPAGSAAPMARVGERLARPDGPGSPFVGHLREYASYLAPRLGMLSPDLSAMLALTARNLAIVWIVLLPVMTILMLGPQFVAMTVHELGVADGPGAQRQQFAFGAAGALLVAWAFLYPEFATSGRWPWLGTRAGLIVGLLGPLGLASLLLLVAALGDLPEYCPGDTPCGRPSVPPDDETTEGPAYPFYGQYVSDVLDYIDFRLGTPLMWAALVGVPVIATLRVLLRRLLRGPCDGLTLVRQWLGTAIGGAVVAVLAIALLEAVGDRWIDVWLAKWAQTEGGNASAVVGVSGGTVLEAIMFAGPALLSLWLVFDVIHVAIASDGRDDLDREHMASVSAAVLLTGAGWLLWCALSFGWPIWLFAPVEWALGRDLGPVFMLFVASVCVAVLAVFGVRWLSAPLHDVEADSPDGRRVRRDGRIAGLAALLLLVVVLRALAMSGSAWGNVAWFAVTTKNVAHLSMSSSARVEGVHYEYVSCTDGRRSAEALPCEVERDGAADTWLTMILAFAAWAAVAGVLIQANRFSMHEIYRTRVARTFLGASRLPQDVPLADARRPDPLTGFDGRDDLPMAALQGLRPLLVVNTALNRGSAEGLSGQERRALPFSISPMHAGSATATIGYRRTERYASLGRFESASAPCRDGGIRLGTAVALSGAATSPNMGYGTHGLAAFVLTLFNVRLGLWLGNPNSKRAWLRSEPPFSAIPLLRDLVADTDDVGPWINLSDGGHFDNLGLYEMIQRRCRLMLCVDATSDGGGDLHHLARVVRMAAVDLGVSIEALSVDDPSPRPAIRAYRVVWPDGVPDADGLLLVIKPVLCGDEPVDVAQYATSHPEFPHESTADQFFGETQFECYRRLGRLSIDRLERFVDGPLRAHPWAGGLLDWAGVD